MEFFADVWGIPVHSRPCFVPLPAARPERRVRDFTTRCSVTGDLKWRDGGRSIEAALHAREAHGLNVQLLAAYTRPIRELVLTPGAKSLKASADEARIQLSKNVKTK